MAEEEKRPIIIRRKVVSGGGHHGGAWKVAYADFVTAMMAFFLLMWLLNATTEDQKKGLADYFNPSIQVHRTSGGGNGPFGGDKVLAELAMAQNRAGTSATPPATGMARDTPTETAASLNILPLDGLAAALIAKGGESDLANRLLQHVRTRVTDEGLVVEISDLPDAPLFKAGETEPTKVMQDLCDLIAEVTGLVTNKIGIDSHLAAPPIRRASDPGWLLSSGRAIVTRRLLADRGIAAMRFARVAGEADSLPAQPNPQDIRNNRVEIVLLRSDSGE